jgi:adenylate cyclase
VNSLGKESSGAAADLSQRIYRELLKIYNLNSAGAAVVTVAMLFVGLDFTARQWAVIAIGAPPVILFNSVLLLRTMAREFRPIGAVLDQIQRRERPSDIDLSRAIVQALNFPQKSFVWMVLIGLGTLTTIIFLFFFSNALVDARFQYWQLLFSVGMILVGSPVQAMVQFFGALRTMVPPLEMLWAVGGILPEQRAEIRSSRLQTRLLFLVIFLSSVPLLFCTFSLLVKVHQLLIQLGVEGSSDLAAPLWRWAIGMLLVGCGGSLSMTILTAREVARATSKLLQAMNDVERGRLGERLHVTSTDEYADLFLGFNVMTAQLRDDAQTLKMSEELMGELQLDVLLQKIIQATIELLDAERGTLFLYDPRTDELWSRVASQGSSAGIHGAGSPPGASSSIQEIRFPATVGIAGAVFTNGKPENISDPYADPRFNPEVDRHTGYRTRSILTTPISAKNGKRIGVTQVLNKRGGSFTTRDAERLAAFTTQIAIALENARLFDDVVQMKNFNDSILRSTSNGMITLDDDRQLTSANDATLAILQTRRETLVGHAAEEIFGGPNEWVIASLEKVSATGVTDVAVDTDLQLANGNVASANLTAVPLIDPANKSIGTMLILDDITREKRIKSTMSRYMSKEVADQLLEAGETLLGGKDQRVSILFSDIRNFTHVSEAIGARETVTMLNEYFAEMVDVVFRYGGILDKYIGDAIMALFGSPFARPDDADNAVAVANDMLVTLRALNQRRQETGRAPIDIGVGIATGQVVAGSIGSPKRMEYTAIGDSVNLASRLEGATKVYGVKILLSDSTAHDLQRPARLREIDLMRVKGKDQPVAIYEAMDHYTKEGFPVMDGVLEAYRCGLERYRSRDWRGGVQFFEAALALHAGDRPSQIYLERCRQFAAEPPPEDWNGVWILAEK